MGAHHFCDKRIKTANQFASRIIVMPQRSFHQRACIRIIHVFEIASTLPTMTGLRALRLQSMPPLDRQEKIVTDDVSLRSLIVKEARKRLAKHQTKQNMKRNVLTLAAVSTITLGGFAVAQGENGAFGGGPGSWHGHGFALEHLTKTLNLTSDQQTKVQPIVDQARPQIIAIHKDAMQKTKAVMDNAASQIRPLLNAGQQKKLDALQKAHQDLMNAMKELHEAQAE